MNIKDSYIHNGTAVLKDIKVESSVLKKILAGKDANDAYLDWETVCDLTGIKPTTAGTADKVGHKISFKNTSNTTIEFDGSAAKDLTGGLYFSKISERVHDENYHDYSHRRTSGNLNFADCGLRYFLATSSMTTGKPEGDSHILHMAWDNGKWEGQLALPTAVNGVMQWRTQGNSDDWADWVTLLDSLNYTSYTVKKDGTGATGTWGINITGKLSKKLTFTGGVTGDWDGSADKTVAIPTKASWDYDDVYLKLAGNGTTNPMTGTIYMDNVDGLIINSHNKTLNIWEVYGNSGSWASQYGFNLQYYGAGSGNDNDLILWAHAQTSTHVEVYRVHQDGSFIFKAAPKVGTNTVYHAGNLSIGTLMGSTAIGDSDEPVYWNGSAFVKAGAYPTKASWNYDDVYLKDLGLDTGNSTDKNKDVSLTNGNVYLKLFKTVNGAESEDSKVKIYGATNVSVTTDSSGDIKITGVDSVTNAANATNATYAANVGTSGIENTNYVTAAHVISMYNWYNTITADDAANNTAIDKWNEIISFLAGITDTSTLSGILAGYSPSGHDHDDRYLKLSGGTLTGVLHLLGSQYADTAGTGALDLANSDIYGVNSIKFSDLSDGAGEGLQWYRDATHTDSLWVKNGVIYFTPNRTWNGTGTNYTVWHSGNDGSESELDADLLDGKHASYFHIQTARNYTTVDALPSGSDGWYNVFTISDTTTGCVICSVRAYAHSSMTFIVSKGYQTNATLQILQFNNSSNGSYFYVKGARVLSDGKVQVLFNKPAANNQSYVSVDINIFSTTGTIRPNATLTLETLTLTDSTSPSIVKSLNGTGGKITSDIVGNLAGNASTATSATTAGTATNLTNAPDLLIDGNTIAVKAGEKTSSYITVPYATNAGTATNAGDASTLGGYAETAFWRNRGQLYQNNGYNADTLKVGGYQFCDTAYGHTGSGAAHAHVLGANSTIEVFSNLQLSTTAWSDDVSYRVKWGGETNATTRPNGWSSWIKLLSSGNYTSYVNTTNFPGLDKTGTVTSVTVTGSNGISGSGTVTTSGTITLSNSGVRAVSINGDQLRVNTNGTNADLDIPNSDKTDGFHINSWGWPYKYYKKITNTVLNQTWYVKLTLGGYAQWKYFVIYTSYNNCNGPVIVKRTGFGSGLEIEYMNTNGNHVVAVCYDAVYHSSEHKNVIFLKFDAIQDSNHYSPSSSADVELWSDCDFTMTNLGATAPTLSSGAKWISTVNGGKAYHGATNHAGTIYPNETNTYDLGTSSLKWGNIYATTLNGSLAWSNLTGVPTILETVTSDTHSYSVSNASWTSTITLPTDAGSYVLTMITGNSTLTGMFSIGSGDTAKDEISLHLHGSDPRLYARTNGTKLEISSNDTSAQNRSVIIKYKRLT